MASDNPSPLDRPGASSSLLAPPTILEPGSEDDDKSGRRTSQLVYHQGFINRYMDFSPAAMNSRAHQSYMSTSGGLVLAKGWKPFKLVLRGSKLYFYKPPSDRSAGIKELFPTELVVDLEDENVVEDAMEPKEPEVTSRSGKGKERDEGRRKRVFWGSGTHPSLVVKDGVVEKGSYEALVHEAVFHTTFRYTTGPSESTETSSVWRDFSSAILCALPSVVDRTQFESEFRRCCTMLIDTTGDDAEKQDAAREKVHWLANLYMTYHGPPINAETWESWRETTIPNLPLGADMTNKASGLPQSSSTQALYTPSPELPSASTVGQTAGSPDLGAFSPRPSGGDRMMSLLDALGEQSQRKRSASYSKAWQAVLSRNGFSREVLMTLDTQVIARSLYIYHMRALQQVPHNVTVTTCLKSEQPDNHDVDPTTTESPSSSPLTPLTGTDERPHWLTKLILLQILIQDSPTFPSQSTYAGRSADEHQPSRSHTRSEVISAWARIGELCRRTGDECSWHAIFAALCSRPIARLDKIWKRVDGDALRIVQSWVYPQEGAETPKVTEPKTIPWAGERVSQMHRALEAACLPDGKEWRVEHLQEAWYTFDSLRTDFSLVSRQSSSEQHDASEDVEVLARHWDDVSSGRANATFHSKLRRYFLLHVLDFQH
jgi:GTPase-activating protein BEM2